MLHLLWTIPFLPLLAFAVLALAGGRMSARVIGLVGTAMTGAAAAIGLVVAAAFITSPPAGRVFSQTLWTWLQVDGFTPRIALYLDPLSLVMMLVVVFVSFLILVYSTEFMRGEEGYRRFFAYMNLFVASMLLLVLADDLLFLLVGWEGVGLSSYLLIGFWYRDPANGAAARKAFIVTRVGDTALLVGLLLIFTELGSLNIQESMGLAQQHWAGGAGLATAAALLILGGALGKSAQLPLQTWLPDAMAGPTPVSALIHAATMVTAGVYLVARTRVLFELSSTARLVVAVSGAATLLYGGLCALAQRDIKRVLAYSTISQIGYMFLALGVAAWSAAAFHFMVHAFFKALLFLGAGLVIKALGEEHDIYKMGGLRHDQPLVFWTFLAGAASLAAVPGVTAGFYSKDLIIESTLTSAQGSAWLWAAAVIGAFLTSLYAFRLVFVAFFGERAEGRAPALLRFGKAAVLPVVAPAVLAIGAGWIQLPSQWGDLALFTKFLEPAAASPAARPGGFAGGVGPQIVVAVVSLAGIYVSYLFFARRPLAVRRLTLSPVLQRLRLLALEGFAFDRLYAGVFVRPFLWLARRGRDDVFDAGFSTIGWSVVQLHGLLKRSQTGRLRYYVAVASLGVLVFIALGIFR